MTTKKFCMQVARRLGEAPALIASRGFKLDRPTRKAIGPPLSATDCPFCGGQVLIGPGNGSIEALCGCCDIAFDVRPNDVYAVSLAKAERPRPRQHFFDLI